MLSGMSNLIQFFTDHPDLKLLISRIQASSDDFWLVGGCIRNTLLKLPQNDIDICCSGDPTPLIQSWARDVSAHWFWLDEKRLQSRVLLPGELYLDFTPLRAPAIVEDLQLRDFTINALALSLKQLSSNQDLLDPTGGVDNLKNSQLAICSPTSCTDDPLRMLKGIRHAVTLSFTLEPDTFKELCRSAHLIINSAGERIRDELAKIFAADEITRGVELLLDTGLLPFIFGPPGESWNRKTAVADLEHLSIVTQGGEFSPLAEPTATVNSEQFSTRAVFLLARLIKLYAPENLVELLHSRLRFSRYLRRLIEELQSPPNLELLSLATGIVGQRREALFVEQFEPFAEQKMVYWSLSDGLLSLARVGELQQSFAAEQKSGRIPDLINGKLVAALLDGTSNVQIGEWLQKIKLAEINGEISTESEAEKWLKNKLSFDKKPI